MVKVFYFINFQRLCEGRRCLKGVEIRRFKFRVEYFDFLNLQLLPQDSVTFHLPSTIPLLVYAHPPGTEFWLTFSWLPALLGSSVKVGPDVALIDLQVKGGKLCAS